MSTPDLDAGGTDPERSPWPGSTMAMVLALVLVAVLSVVAIVGLDDRRSEDDHFVAVIRDQHPAIDSAAISDSELLTIAHDSCGPDGMSDHDRRRLERLGIDAGGFRRDADALCPTR